MQTQNSAVAQITSRALPVPRVSSSNKVKELNRASLIRRLPVRASPPVPVGRCGLWGWGALGASQIYE